MATRSICYRKSDGVVVCVKDVGWEWSDIERGLKPTHLGEYFGVATVDVDVSKTEATKVVDTGGVSVTVAGDTVTRISESAQVGDWVVDDVGTPTAISQKQV